MANVGDQVHIEVTVQEGRTLEGGRTLEYWWGKVASVEGDDVELLFHTHTGRFAKLPVAKKHLRPCELVGSWSLAVQVKPVPA